MDRPPLFNPDGEAKTRKPAPPPPLKPATRLSPEEECEKIYGIPASTPKKERIERLLLMEVLPEDITEITDLSRREVDEAIAQIHSRWARMGERQDEDNKVFERGKAIRNLQLLQTRLLQGGSDPRKQEMLLKVQAQLMKLQDIEELSLDSVAAKIDALEAALSKATVKQLELARKLINETTTSVG